jgi:hypothetical protein
MTNNQLITLAKFTGILYRQTMDLLYIANYGMNAGESVDFLFKVWVKYRDIDRSKWQHKQETQYINDRVRIEYAILNQSIEQALELLNNSINKLEL